MMELDGHAWFTVAVIAAMAVSLIKEIARPDLVFLCGLAALLLAGVISPGDAFAGFSNPAVLTVAALFVVAAGVQQTEALGFVDRLLFPRSAHPRWSLPRLMLPTAALSAVLNNTPIVAMLAPRVQQWARRVGLPPSRLLIPLSYAAIVGGMVTLIGTSTNIIVSGLLEAEGYPPLGLFDLTWIGVPAVLVVVAYFVLVGYRLLPDRGQASGAFAEGLDDCLFEVRVAAEGPPAGQTVEEAGLRALGEAYLVHLRRGEHVMPAAPDAVVQGGDVLTFAGSMAVLDDLLQRPGLRRSVPPVGGEDVQTLPLYEAVVAESSNLVGKTLRAVRFRERYGGVVLAIQRRSERVSGSLGRIAIKPGDLLLVEARDGFDAQWNAQRDEFYLVAPRRPLTARPQPGKAPLAWGILLTMAALVGLRIVPLVTAAFAAALALILTRCLSGEEARKALNVQVLVIIAAALGLGRAVEQTGLSDVLASAMLAATAGLGTVGTLAALYVTTNLLTELITHKAAAVLMLPVALAAALELGLEPKAAALVVTVGAAASFMTPIGYQTNLMVMAAGGYRFRDYLRAGLPVSLLVMSVALTVMYWVWIR